MRIIPYEQMNFVWETDRYDFPLSGLCRLNNKLCRFKILNWEKETPDYKVYNLSFPEKLYWLWKKKVFEICIGRHCTYPDKEDGIHFYYKKPKWIWKIIFNIYFHRYKIIR